MVVVHTLLEKIPLIVHAKMACGTIVIWQNVKFVNIHAILVLEQQQLVKLARMLQEKMHPVVYAKIHIMTTEMRMKFV